MVKRHIIVWSVVAVLALLVGTVIGGGFYMFDYSLTPEKNRADTAYCYRHLFENYPETRSWVDSLGTGGLVPVYMVRGLVTDITP